MIITISGAYIQRNRHRLGMHWLYGLMPYGKSFLKVRKAANKYFSVEAVKGYHDLLHISVRTCLRDLVHAPENFEQNFRECVLL